MADESTTFINPVNWQLHLEPVFEEWLRRTQPDQPLPPHNSKNFQPPVLDTNRLRLF
jgi:hypothetical protein